MPQLAHAAGCSICHFFLAPLGVRPAVPSPFIRFEGSLGSRHGSDCVLTECLAGGAGCVGLWRLCSRFPVPPATFLFVRWGCWVPGNLLGGLSE